MSLNVKNGVFPTFTKTVKKTAVYDMRDSPTENVVLFRDTDGDTDEISLGGNTLFAFRQGTSTANPMTNWFATTIEYTFVLDENSDRAGTVTLQAGEYIANYHVETVNRILSADEVKIRRNSTNHIGMLLYNEDYEVTDSAEFINGLLVIILRVENSAGEISELEQTRTISTNGLFYASNLYSVFGTGQAILHPGVPGGFHRTRLSPDLKVEFKPQGGES